MSTSRKESRESPMVSICCITYNHEPYIRACLDGFVMQQTNFPFEVLIHDDASTDNTQEIIREYEVKYPDIIKPIYQTENQYSKGVSVFIVHNFPRARGQYVAMCEGDDYWTDPLKLQKQVDFLEANPEYGMCYTQVNRFLQKSEQFEELPFPDAGYCSTEELFRFNSIPTPTVVMGKEILLNYIKDVVPYCQCVFGDYPRWLYFSLHSKIKFMNEVTAVYRISEESGCHTRDMRKAICRISSVTEMKIFFNARFKMGYSSCLLKMRLFYNKLHYCWMKGEYRLLLQVLLHKI